MLTALGIDEAAHLVCCPPPSGRALDPEARSRPPRASSASPTTRSRSRSRSRKRSTLALLATPEEGQVVITGSLYVVGAARSILVTQVTRAMT